MEENTVYRINDTCYGCLRSSDGKPLQSYSVRTKTLKAAFQMDDMVLCFKCYQKAKQAELFIKKVQRNQTKLNKKLAKLCKRTENLLNSVNCQLQSETNLKQVQIQSSEPSEYESNTDGTLSIDKHCMETGDGDDANCMGVGIDNNNCMVDSADNNCMGDSIDKNCIETRDGIDQNGLETEDGVDKNSLVVKDIVVKIEIEDDRDDLLQTFDDEFVPDDNTDLGNCVKEEDDEDDYPLKLLKEELQLEGVDIKYLKKSTKKGKVKKKNEFKTKVIETVLQDKHNVLVLPIETITITHEQCMEERLQMAADEKYLNSQYKCTDCLKGFSLKEPYDKHIFERHHPSAGDFECDICKRRMDSEEKLRSHKRYHSIRFRCRECGLIRNTRVTIKDHITVKHCNGLYQYTCPHCFKVFKGRNSLRKHIGYKHAPRKRSQCEYCSKIYKCSRNLQKHIAEKHLTDTRVKVQKNHICPDCGMAFASPSQLRNHSIKHTERRDYYCVECDKSFKSDYILKHHLQTALPHINYVELRYPCRHCDKRFATKRDVERHTNRVHLNIKPYQCDQCERAYINPWSLSNHKKYIHEGYKRPMKYPCSMCDRIFDRKSILKTHIYTHTGERPYQCTKCPAQFTQAGILRTHVKLIHLRLTRDGRPKGSKGS